MTENNKTLSRSHRLTDPEHNYYLKIKGDVAPVRRLRDHIKDGSLCRHSKIKILNVAHMLLKNVVKLDEQKLF
jgi:hypothetical protein